MNRKDRLLDAEAPAHPRQRVLVDRDFERDDLLAVAVSGQAERPDLPAHRAEDRHPVRLADQGVAPDAVEQSELDMGDGEILAQAQHLAAGEPQRRDREPGNLPDVLADDRGAFAQAGARSLMLSHWRVRDDAAAKLSVGTVRGSAAGLPRAEALRQAQLALMADRSVPDAAHPAIWAPFVIVEN